MPHTLRHLRRFARDERGNLTMEFVLWVPVLMFWLMLSLVVYDAYSTRNRASKAAYTISDIISRKSVLDSTTLEQVYLLQQKLLPRAGENKALRITNIRCNKELEDDPCTYEIVWSIKKVPEGGLDGYEVIDTLEKLPVGLLPPMRDREEVLLVDLNVPFKAISEWVGIDAQEWEVRVVTRTRYVAGLSLGQDLEAGT